MIFSRNGEFDVVTRVTGPHHHYLGLVLRTDRVTALAEIEDLSASPETGSVYLARVEQLRSEVSRGVAASNEQLGMNYQASRIRFCSVDPSEGCVPNPGRTLGPARRAAAGWRRRGT